jgi:hypothetical protein
MLAKSASFALAEKDQAALVTAKPKPLCVVENTA